MHDVGGNWIGWGPGDDDPKVLDMIAYLKRKFTWVRLSGLPDTTVYTGVIGDPNLDAKPAETATTMVMVVKQLQINYGDLPVTGIMNAATQQRCGYWKPVKPKPILFTVHGTGQRDPMGIGLPADVARALVAKGVCDWQPIGNYLADPFPMWPSVLTGLAELQTQWARADFAGRQKWLAGYSQGAIVTSYFYKHNLMEPNSPLYHTRNDLVKAVAWGNPMVEVGPEPDHTGIMEDRLVDTPSWWVNYSNVGDIYCDTPNNDMGEYYRAICKLIMWSNWWVGPDAITTQIAEMLQKPVNEAWAAIQAVIGAGMFFGSGTRAHMYDPRPAIDYLSA